MSGRAKIKDADGKRVRGQKIKKCGCPRADQAKPHMCPYKSDVDDDQTHCTCCKSCEATCAEDI
jgi:hypothetical protein